MQGAVNSQSIAFHHLNTTHGLTDNDVTAVTTDHNGFLWIGTTTGLHLYDGSTLTVFRKEKYPALCSDKILGLLCDSKNRIWVGSDEGVTMLDENRIFHRIVLSDSISIYSARTQVETNSYGVIILSNMGHFYFNEKTSKWTLLKFSTDIILKENYTDGIAFSPDSLLICGSFQSVFLVDYAKQKEIFRIHIPDVITACKLNDSTIFVATSKGQMYVVNIRTRLIEERFTTAETINGKKKSTNIIMVRKAANGKIIITSSTGGIYIFNPGTKQLQHFVHEPYNSLSLISNNTSRIHCEENGNVFISSRTAGLTFFNVKNYTASYINNFRNKNGDVFDGFITDITKDKNNIFWIAAFDRLIQWDPVTNISQFFYYPYPIEGQMERNLQIHAVCVDRQNNVWVGTAGGGIGLLNKVTGSFKIFNSGFGGNDSVLRSNFIYHFELDEEGFIWAASRLGVYKIDPKNRKFDLDNNHPALKELSDKQIYFLHIDQSKNFWFGTRQFGTYYWNRSIDTLKNYTTKNNLISDSCYAVLEARDGTIYIGSFEGMSVLKKDGSIENYTSRNGLRLDRCLGFLEDETGNIWMNNDACLVCFDPQKKTFRYFDQKAGLSSAGFRFNAYFKDTDGTLFWGSEKGLNYFQPSQLLQINSNPNPIIFKLTIGDSTELLTDARRLRLAYRNNNITFHFAAVNVFGSRNVLYQYLLQGIDKTWTTVLDQHEIRYNSLPSGDYAFLLKASADGVNWVSAPYSVNVTIEAPLWQKWWFIVALLSFIGLIIYGWMKNREKIIKQREAEKTDLQKLKTLSYQHQLEIEQVINYFATSLNEQNTVDGILWDVAKNCISKLGFEDCVIYLCMENSNVLIQKAAWGPKTSELNKILNPIEIPWGKGIVGSVAATGKAEIINDTSLDPRYIEDDERRHSEITVPIFHEGRVIGVIDSEHSIKNFYTQRHLHILSTIASLCADKMILAISEENRQSAQLEALENKQKATEALLQSMRLQMNPHFLFNALNSIQQMILAGEDTVATRFLSKFSKLLRLVLTNSDKEKISLNEELEILNLYVELESLRFKESFEFSITCDATVDKDETYVPALFFQPFVENAIWHGLMHKEGYRRLIIHFEENNNNALVCTIEDNGVGRTAASIMKENSADRKRHSGKGMSVAAERLKIWNEKNSANSTLEIIDMQNGENKPAGTKIIIQLQHFN